MARSRTIGAAPVDFICFGVCAVHGWEVHFGLRFWKIYRMATDPLVLSSSSLGLPMSRRQVFIAM
eukprot:5768690-Alexandrium_andersonii.AAC.1